MNIYLVRHGQSIDASNNLHQRDDSLLSEKGLTEAHQLGARFQKIDIDYVIASPIPRAKQTAEIITSYLDKTVVIDELFVERVWPLIYRSGTQKETSEHEGEARGIQRLMNVDHLNPLSKHSDEETFFELETRATKALRMLEDLNYKNVLIVSHNAFIRMMTLSVILEGQNVKEAFLPSLGTMGMSNTGITVLKYDPLNTIIKWKLVSWNDTSHIT